MRMSTKVEVEVCPRKKKAGTAKRLKAAGIRATDAAAERIREQISGARGVVHRDPERWATASRSTSTRLSPGRCWGASALRPRMMIRRRWAACHSSILPDA